MQKITEMDSNYVNSDHFMGGIYRKPMGHSNTEKLLVILHTYKLWINVHQFFYFAYLYWCVNLSIVFSYC